ncbi:hypothetical protein NM208_g10827 [Fusarium decemcellulare]|uniref:Uncharacterized protein n=1 Tax=Fusarium decemcellulare TaxID=57161 RepID=A0ACC1RWH1_9HYPO|nr:hypothetical protein NM208_g10827 [Fusarium decemcellulare]
MAPQPASSDELTGPTLGTPTQPVSPSEMMSIGNCDPQPDAGDTIARRARAGSDRWQPSKIRPHMSSTPARCLQEAVLSSPSQLSISNRTRSSPRTLSTTVSNNNTTTMAIGMMMKMATAASCTGPNIPNVGPFQEDRFEQLVLRLKDALGPSSGLTSDDVDVEFLTRLMEDYDGSDNQWSKYAFGDHSRGYTRNLVDEGNGKSNLLVLVWTPGKGSPIHDHGNAHCLMKILKGNLTETRYAFPEENEQERPMRVISEKTYKENAVAYMADELGLHRVSNKGSDFAVSLHLYTPPNVAKKGCHIFEEKTGRRSHVPSCHYFSAYGRLLKE